MILYHFTSFAALKHINPKLFDGTQAGDSLRWTDDLKPGPDSWQHWRDVIIGVEASPPVVWLTSDPNPTNALPMLPAADLRFNLALGSHLKKLERLEDYLIKVMAAEQVQRNFAAPAILGLGPELKHWLLYFGTIPCDRIRALEEI
jgi:hypothetical protein